MIYRVDYSEKAEKDLVSLKKTNIMAFKKASRLLNELMDHPRSGTGHPEPLKGGEGITWSRRITKGDRLIYEIYDDTVFVMVISAKGHYDDK
ncbi:MAG: Txe/YoeB family addiction module toxin [Bacteroidales bacterium]|nr:Txe/YoeB family addiction module toxin [Bacteroidales bacterium]